MSDDSKFLECSKCRRWIFVILGMVVNMCLGLSMHIAFLRNHSETLFNSSATEGNLPFSDFSCHVCPFHILLRTLY